MFIRCKCSSCGQLFCFEMNLKIELDCENCLGFQVRKAEDCLIKKAYLHVKTCDDCKSDNLDIPQSN